MLVLNRAPGETIHITGGIKITVLEVANGKARLGIDAPKEIEIVRGELMSDSGDVPCGYLDQRKARTNPHDMPPLDLC